MTTYSTPEVCELTGATYRQVDYFARKGLIPGQPAGHGTGSGHRRRWNAAQVERVTLLLRASRLVNATLGEAVEMLDVG
jgi:DNA-binding transcriptional MerR regulator